MILRFLLKALLKRLWNFETKLHTTTLNWVLWGLLKNDIHKKDQESQREVVMEVVDWKVKKKKRGIIAFFIDWYHEMIQSFKQTSQSSKPMKRGGF